MKTKVLLTLLILLWSSLGLTGSCKYGTDCYCDRVAITSNAIYDPALLVCEDWEAPTLYDDVGFGDTAPLSLRGSGGTHAGGPWYDHSLYGFRGSNNYMSRKYGSPGSGGAWKHLTPISPKRGITCINQDPSGICAEGAYRFDDLWDANKITNYSDGTSTGACIDIIKTGFQNANAEGAELGIPDTPGTIDNRGVFDGNQTFGYRVGPGTGTHENQACGIVGEAKFNKHVYSVGVTYAMAYGDNTGSLVPVTNPGIAQLKHEEFANNLNPAYMEFWITGNTGLRATAGFPFSGFRFTKGESACLSALAGATITAGEAKCEGIALRIGTVAGQYTQSTDWPFGKYGCVRAYMGGMNTSNMTYQIWYNNGVSEKLVFSMTGFNAASAMFNQYYDFFKWNSYANANAAIGGYTGLNGKFRRWIDNVHVREGMPVSCSQIGFSGSASTPNPTPAPTKPSAPKNLRVI
jgi:hypothetical protein